MALKIKKLETVEVEIKIAIPPVNPKITGTILGHAVVRSKPEIKVLSREMRNVDENDEELETEPKWSSDEQIIADKTLFTQFDGVIVERDGKDVTLTGQEAIDEVANGDLSSYLVPACTRAYFKHFGEEAPAKNSRRSPRR